MNTPTPKPGDRVLFAGEDDMHQGTVVRLGRLEHREALVRDEAGNEHWHMFADLELPTASAARNVRDAVIKALAEADSRWNDDTGDGALEDRFLAHLADALIERGLISTNIDKPTVAADEAAIERAAKAIWDKARGPGSTEWERHVPAVREMYRGYARAALGALTERRRAVSGIRNLHRAMGALQRLQHEAATGICGIGQCDKASVGYIQGVSNIPAGVCTDHKSGAEQRGYTIHPDPLAEGDGR